MSHLRYIKVSNYRSIKKEIKFDFSPISIFIGPNNSGKSTALKSFIILNTIKDIIKSKGIQSSYIIENSSLKDVNLKAFQDLNETTFKFPYKLLGLPDILECSLTISSNGAAEILLNNISLFHKDKPLIAFEVIKEKKVKNQFSIFIDFMSLINLYNKSNRLYRHTKRYLDELKDILKDVKIRNDNPKSAFELIKYSSPSYLYNYNYYSEGLDHNRLIDKSTGQPINSDKLKRIENLRDKLSQFPLIETMFPIGIESHQIEEEFYRSDLYPGYDITKPEKIEHLQNYNYYKLDPNNVFSLEYIFDRLSKVDEEKVKEINYDNYSVRILDKISSNFKVTVSLNDRTLSLSYQSGKKEPFNILLYKYILQALNKLYSISFTEEFLQSRFIIYNKIYNKSHLFINNFLLPNLRAFNKLESDYEEIGYIANDRDYFNSKESDLPVVIDMIKNNKNNIQKRILSELNTLGIYVNDKLLDKKIENGFLDYIQTSGYGERKIIPIILSIAYFNYVKGIKDYTYDLKFRIPFSLIIEEPESNLHPNAQSRLADFFIHTWKGDNTQSIIETHSEYFVRRLQYLIAKNEINNEHVTIFYFPVPNKDNSQINPYKIHINSSGELSKEFGKGFYDETINLSFDYYRLKKELKN